MRPPQDATGRPIAVGDRVKWRGKIYTIKAFGEAVGRFGTHTIEFKEPRHIEDEIPDEISIDLWTHVTKCCANGCGQFGAIRSGGMAEIVLPFCEEHLKNEDLVRAWEEL